LGNSSNLIVGETVAAVGNPFGLSGSLTEGIISGLGRLLPSTPENIFGNDNRVASFSIPDIIQTDAAINPGNSGGPLLNLNGEVIGINSAIFSNTGVYAGVGFAIPSNTLKKVIPELMKNGSYPHPWLGITGVDVTPDIAKKMNLTEAQGFLVIDVNSNGPADTAGIRGGYIVEIINNTQYRLGGDVIVGIDNQTIKSVSDITDYLMNKKEGDIVKLKILRDNEILNVPVNLKIIQRPLDQQDEVPPFNPKDFGDDQGKFTEQLKKECMMNFNESICNFLFR
jgi:S1-C subfamily serine protease